MWTLLLDQSFLLGAALVTLVHATKFGELNLGNRGGPGCLNRISASISGASAGVRLPSGGAAA
jgi:hypothetical protein